MITFIKMAIKWTSAFLFTVGLFTVTGQEMIHRLSGQIIRSYAIHPDNEMQMLIGIKGEKAGDGVVYLSNDAGESWKATNNGLAIGDSVDDVQCVAFVDENIFLAGTWKQGLFVTKNGGKSWFREKKFPFADVRSIVVDPARQRIFISGPEGLISTNPAMKVWNSVADFPGSWSLTLDASTGNVYAMTFDNGIKGCFKAPPPSFAETPAGTMFFDMCIDTDGNFYAAGASETEGSVIFSLDKGVSWEALTCPKEAAYTSIESVDGKLIVGSWNYPVMVLEDGKWDSLMSIESRTLTKIKATDEHIFYFTWGNGIYRQPRRTVCTYTLGETLKIYETSIEWEVSSTCPPGPITFELYNRWGQKVVDISANSIDELVQKLTPEVKQANLNSEVYIYIFSGDFGVQNGNITVLR